MPTQKTYWHLEHLKRKPTDYDLLTSKLLYYVDRGFEVNVPVEDWYRRHQKGSPLVCTDWEAFRDPRETTYTKYTELQKTKEIFVDGLLKAIDDTGYDRKLSPDWVRVLERVMAPLRYPVHGLQMVAAYVGQMAPSGRITVVSLFQAGDEMRRVQRLAYRMRQLQDTHAGFGDRSRSVWQDDPLWQPLRRVIEQLLVTYDWGEAFVALNLALKPMFDELFLAGFGRLAQSRGDDLLARIFLSLREDCEWHRDWSRALVRMAAADREENADAVAAWLERWRPLVVQALSAFAPVFDDVTVLTDVDITCREYWTSLDRASERSSNAFRDPDGG